MNRNIVLGVTAASTFICGGVVGYVVARRTLEKKLQAEYDAALDREIQATQTFHKMVRKTDEFETPQSTHQLLHPGETPLLVEAAKAVRSYSGVGPTDQMRNIFNEKSPDEPSEEELRNRTEEAPYVISYVEFMRNETEFTQDTLTYYRDGVLADNQEEPVPDIDDLVGENNLTKFGHMSNDSRVVYIRNDAKQLEFEIVMSDGNYGALVHGVGTES